MSKFSNIEAHWWVDEYNLVWMELLGDKFLLGVYYE